MNGREQAARHILDRACAQVGVSSDGATVVRIGENAIFRLPGGGVARIARTGQVSAARREVAAAGWMERAGVPAVRLTEPAAQPVVVDGRAVTFWRELSAHEHGTPRQVALALRRLHDVPPPGDIGLGAIQPFVRLAERIARGSTLGEDDRSWLRDHLAELEQRWSLRPPGLPECVVHGDAWAGNVVSLASGEIVFLDLERTAIGSPEWDLVHTAIKYVSFGWIGEDEYRTFSEAYGHDVTGWAGFELFRDIREFRMTCMAVQVAAEEPDAVGQALHRVRCLRGENGPRPWSGWSAVS